MTRPSARKWLPPDVLKDVVRHAPLVSIDLVVRDLRGRVLVGLRNNEPARDSWFVPGGIIAKNESLDDAFRGIAEREVGIAFERGEARFLGVFEHLYETNFSGDPSFGTHYVVLAHEVRLPVGVGVRMDDQHRTLRWVTPEELGSDPGIHANTRAYASALSPPVD